MALPIMIAPKSVLISQNGHNPSASSTIFVKVIEITPPVIHNCPTDQTRYVSSNESRTRVYWTEPTATDNVQVVSFTTDYLPGDWFPIGTTIVTYTAIDEDDNSTVSSFKVTIIRDNESPVIHNCPDNLTVYTGSNSSSAHASATWSSPSATDNCGYAHLTSDYSSGYEFPLGATRVTYTATDSVGNTANCQFTVTVIDNTPPNISVSLSPTDLWPPNHRMVSISASITATDNSSQFSWVLESITSNEPDEGEGDGDTANDIQGATLNTDDTSFSLRRERSGRGTGRIYTITYKATDSAGNISRASANVSVPHDR